MRLRYSQFVFLLLLVCSVQNPQDYAQSPTAGPAFGRTSLESQHSETDPSVARRSRSRSLPARLSAPETSLDPASRRVHSTPWEMRRPALASAAIASFTGYLRA